MKSKVLLETTLRGGCNNLPVSILDQHRRISPLPCVTTSTPGAQKFRESFNDLKKRTLAYVELQKPKHAFEETAGNEPKRDDKMIETQELDENHMKVN